MKYFKYIHLSVVCLTLGLTSLKAQTLSEDAKRQDSILKQLSLLTKEIELLKQPKKTQAPAFAYKSGIGMTTPDSAYSLNIRFRFQNRILMNTTSDEDLGPASWEARVRRARLSLTGHVLNKNITYHLQLSFARGDLDWSDADASKVNTSPNVLRDAIVYYKPTSNLQFGMGQAKLPTSRQRIASSGALQFYDRSIVNNSFAIDRDFGLFVNYTSKLAENFIILSRGAVSTGDGRNTNMSNPGLAYTARIELLPLGAFTDNGDYFEGDLAREKKPKLALAAAYNRNDRAVRNPSSITKDLNGEISYYTYMADMVFKFKGFALSSEYMYRNTFGSPDVYGTDNKVRTVLVGDGINNQISYCTKNMWEVALRQSLVTPAKNVFSSYRQLEQYGVGLSKYLMKHKLKVQANVFYNRERDLITHTDLNKYFFAVFQVEIGI